MSYPMEGGCSCAALRYRLKRAPMFVHCCHCLDCQKQTGSAFAINALIETSEIELLQGALVAIAMPTESGAPHAIYRCPICQVAVWSDYGGRAYARFVRVATLGAPHAIAPDVHIYVRSRVPWVRLPEGARSFEAYYDRKQEWPPEALARWRAAADASRA